MAEPQKTGVLPDYTPTVLTQVIMRSFISSVSPGSALCVLTKRQITCLFSENFFVTLMSGWLQKQEKKVYQRKVLYDTNKVINS